MQKRSVQTVWGQWVLTPVEIYWKTVDSFDLIDERSAFHSHKEIVCCKRCWMGSNISCLQIGQTYQVWDSLESTRLEVRCGVIKCRILTGTYIVQSLHCKFNQLTLRVHCAKSRMKILHICFYVVPCFIPVGKNLLVHWINILSAELARSSGDQY